MTIDNKCKNCGGELIYDVSSGELKCMQCDSIVDIPEQNANATKVDYTETSTLKISTEEYTQYSCSTCGRKHITPVHQELVNCPSCGDCNLEKNVSVSYVPDGIIPFKLDKEKAMQSFSQWLRKRFWAPNNLKKLAKTESLKGTYFPIYNYDFNCFSKYSGVGVKSRRGLDGKTYTTRHKFKGDRNDNFINYVDSANTTIPSGLLREMSNFDYTQCYIYRTEFLYGWIGLDNNIDIHNSFVKVKQSSKQEIEKRIKQESKYDSVENLICDTEYTNIKYNYLYVPVWVNYYNYKGKTFNCFINGITGKVSGDAPKSFWKRFFAILGIIAVGVLLYFLTK